MPSRRSAAPPAPFLPPPPTPPRLFPVGTQGAASPGSANVIGSGQKLPPQRPLNEVLSAAHGFGGPVLVPQGANDKVSGPARAQERAAAFGRVGAVRGGLQVSLIAAGGHCPQDDAPGVVAETVWGWLVGEVAGR